MKLITLYLPELYIEALDQLVKTHFYPSRAEAIRLAVRDLLQEAKGFRLTKRELDVFPAETEAKREGVVP